MSFATDRSLSLYSARARPVQQVRGFSYSTLVEPEGVLEIRTYQADDFAFAGAARPSNHRCNSYGSTSGQSKAAVRDDCWSSITESDFKQGIWGADVFGTDADFTRIDDEDVPRIEGKARRLRRRAHRRLAIALEKARKGWEALWRGFSHTKNRRGVVPTPYFS
ncbi:hypothetical protein GGI02_003395 [Coemansia sp. RSA 2322]|uniref:Uncharacterized protein n=1 Tax=Coemansia thaxteri TaxID=2663907 RepID=A0A9W8BM13_9FUNG|nr:hypothetical protein H4R26_000773 [Coemansia thaxteri]KAJ2469435.1 hypothetical protein GGI02_003395 [Coemansia sp. RSA 2322]